MCSYFVVVSHSTSCLFDTQKSFFLRPKAAFRSNLKCRLTSWQRPATSSISSRRAISSSVSVCCSLCDNSGFALFIFILPSSAVQNLSESHMANGEEPYSSVSKRSICESTKVLRSSPSSLQAFARSAPLKKSFSICASISLAVIVCFMSNQILLQKY